MADGSWQENKQVEYGADKGLSGKRSDVSLSAEVYKTEA